MTEPRGLTRREFIAGAAASGVILATGCEGEDARDTPRPGSGPTVAVLGGGVAGLTAAHELAERGFRVTVVERKALGGKARSIPVPGSSTGGRLPLPGEHGFRFYPGFYRHLPDTMRRTPAGGGNVRERLVPAPTASFARDGGRRDLHIPHTPGALLEPGALQKALISAYAPLGQLSRSDREFFARRMATFMLSCDARRIGQWERQSWWDFVDAQNRSEEYRRLLAVGITRNLVAARAELASTRTIGLVSEAFLFSFLGRGTDGAPDRVLDAPTNEAWIDPWVAHLRSLGVKFRLGREVNAIEMRRGRVAAATARGPQGSERIEAKYFVLAVPVERARRLLSRELLAADPRLEGLRDLRTEWMNGVQLFLRRPVGIVEGHVSYIDSPWALTSISQAQFWKGRDFRRDYGDGEVADCLSVDVSNWTTPGVRFGRPAERCSRDEIITEVIAQIRGHIDDRGAGLLPPEVIHSAFLDPAIRAGHRGRRAGNDEPLLVNTVDSLRSRPPAQTAVENLVLASDYVRTNVDLATMEGANEAARRAVNAILETSGSSAEPAKVFKLERPIELEGFKEVDAKDYAAGRPHALEGPPR